MNKILKNGKTPYEVYVRFNGKLTELIDTNINLGFRILI